MRFMIGLMDYYSESRKTELKGNDLKKNGSIKKLARDKTQKRNSRNCDGDN